MTRDDLKRLLAQAAEMAKDLPENMQGAGFHRTLDLLLLEEGIRLEPIEGSGSGAGPRKRSRKKTRAKAATGKKSNARRSGAGGGSRRSGRSGAQAAVRELAATGFFKSSKTIGDVQKHLDAKRGLRYAQTSLSGPLLLLVREGVLDREKNDTGTYEYKLP